MRDDMIALSMRRPGVVLDISSRANMVRPEFLHLPTLPT